MLKNVKIGKKLILAFIVVAVIVSIAGFCGLGLLINLDKGYGTALVENGFVQGDIGNYNTYLNKGGAIVRDIITLTDPAEVKAAQAEFEDVKAKTQAALEAATVNCTTPAELELLATINKTAPLYKTPRDKAIELALAGKKEEAIEMFRTEARPYLNECMTAAQKLMEINVKNGDAVSEKLSTQSRVGIITIIAVVTFGLLLSIFLGIVIARDIYRPVNEIEQMAVKMAAGNYNVHIDYDFDNEIGSLARNMNTMVDTTKAVVDDTARGLNEIAAGNFDIAPKAEFIGVFAEIKEAIQKIVVDMSETMAQIKVSAEQVSAGSEQVSSGAQALAQGATEQASSVQQLSASINEVAEQIEQNASNAVSANELVNNVGGTIDESNEQMTSMIGAMSEISISSQEIGKIIKTIEDIAFQTNILALNAAVEAARAGAAGKGFAVVADEVRNLATKSSEAAKQTSALIEGSVTSVAHGVSIADATAKSLADVVTGAQQITALIGKITDASADQATSIAQINLGVEQISAVVQTNSATSEESAAASEELNGQAIMLKNMVSRFKILGSSQQ
ncbi:MAG: methyl-accepting chemotaxis protein [Oscillospiraceae bacterium]